LNVLIPLSEAHKKAPDFSGAFLWAFIKLSAQADEDCSISASSVNDTYFAKKRYYPAAKKERRTKLIILRFFQPFPRERQLTI